jgi:hypothetical protein
MGPQTFTFPASPVGPMGPVLPISVGGHFIGLGSLGSGERKLTDVGVAHARWGRRVQFVRARVAGV